MINSKTVNTLIHFLEAFVAPLVRNDAHPTYLKNLIHLLYILPPYLNRYTLEYTDILCWVHLLVNPLTNEKANH